ncbi:MAG TPA: DISARM system SNF2-like helicase DrmD [Thermoanaerobaculia bacterium]|nr:DISARM system SNF2-like helicase DrmD [Thermoanaerobaculia bacterium]
MPPFPSDSPFGGTPELGQLVSVRQRRYVTTEVGESVSRDRGTSVSFDRPEHLVSLSCLEDDALGEEIQVIWELEPGARVLEKVDLPPSPTAFDDPTTLDAFLDAVRWGAASSADVRALQAPFHSGIDIEDYQLDPVVRAIRMPRANLLIADDVGLGKTIEAGLVMLELILRHRARRILVACPSSLQIQWRDQMRDKFGLEFRIVDSDLLRQLRRERGLHANPWKHFPRLITSIDFLKRERPLRLFKETLPSEGEALYPRRYDVLVVDEAHNCAPSGRGKYATDSQRTLALRTITPHFEHKLFLTATPHNGYIESFSAVLELLDNQRFHRGTEPDRKQLAAVMVRRLKSEMKDFTGARRFPDRVLEALEVDYTAEEKAAHDALRRYTTLREHGIRHTGERLATEFVLKTLKKRLFSSPAAFASTLARHEETLKALRKADKTPTASVLRRQIADLEEEYADDQEAEEATRSTVEAATRLFRDPTDEEDRLLREMRQWADRAVVGPDAKARILVDSLKKTVRPAGTWAETRVIIFTEYRTTQKWLQERLAYEGFGGGRVMLLYGGMDPQQREAVKAAFQYDPKQSPVRILLATDAASEGIDLQNHCSRLIHYEIPWNPNRMEQRNGRIDRHGQREAKVEIYHFVGRGFRDHERSGAYIKPGDLEGDLEFLLRAAKKVQAIREDLGKVGPVIADQVEEAMFGRRRSLDTDRAESEAAPVRRMLKFERNLREQIQRLRDQLGETMRELRLSPANIERVVTTALDLAGQPALLPATNRIDVPGPSFQLPALTGSWQYCAEGLRHPHSGEVRRIVFDHILASGRDDLVLAHLNHRLVQMSLRLLRAEVWSTEGKRKLQRVTARLAPDEALREPVMIAHARLVVIGGNRHRLHEEIIHAGGVLREGRFVAINVGETERALAATLPAVPSAALRQTLLALYPKHRAALAGALEARMRDRTNGLERLLAERRDKEVSDIRKILEELRRLIAEKLDDPGLEQMTFEGWETPEREQLERNLDALRVRLREIPTEIDRETAAAAARFSNLQPRLFPVAVTFVVPRRLTQG